MKHNKKIEEIFHVNIGFSEQNKMMKKYKN